MAEMENGHKPDQLIYTLLPEERWEDLRKFFHGEPGFVPPPQLGSASVALNAHGDIVAACILQLISYIGPLKTLEEYRARVNYRHLKANIDTLFQNNEKTPLLLRGYIALPRNSEVAALAEATGMTRLECPAVLIQEFAEKQF